VKRRESRDRGRFNEEQALHRLYDPMVRVRGGQAGSSEGGSQMGHKALLPYIKAL